MHEYWRRQLNKLTRFRNEYDTDNPRSLRNIGIVYNKTNSSTITTKKLGNPLPPLGNRYVINYRKRTKGRQIQLYAEFNWSLPLFSKPLWMHKEMIMISRSSLFKLNAIRASQKTFTKHMLLRVSFCGKRSKVCVGNVTRIPHKVHNLSYHGNENAFLAPNLNLRLSKSKSTFVTP